MCLLSMFHALSNLILITTLWGVTIPMSEVKTWHTAEKEQTWDVSPRPSDSTVPP